MADPDVSAGEHAPSAWGTRRFGLEKLWLFAVIAAALAIVAGLVWLASQAG